LAASIGRALIPTRFAFTWCALLAFSYEVMGDWVLQLRGDFMAVVFGLLSVRLLMVPSLATAFLAGMAAGLATHFKFTYLAALGAGFLWLMARRQWKALAVFVIAGLFASVGGFAAFSIAEPKMFANMFAFTHPSIQFAGWAKMFLTILREPVALLAFATVPTLTLRGASRWALLLIFVSLSLGIASATSIQAGANINYFFEALLALTPVAALGILRLSHRHLIIGALFVSLVLLSSAEENAMLVIRSAGTPTAEAKISERAMALQPIMQQQHVLALASEVAIFAPDIIIPEPWTASHLERIGKLDLDPIAQEIRNESFNLIVVPKVQRMYRGIDHVSPTLRLAISDKYQPFCVFDDWLLFLRPGDSSSSIARQLANSGCDVQACSTAGLCRSW
jgi:hypothetical protein